MLLFVLLVLVRVVLLFGGVVLGCLCLFWVVMLCGCVALSRVVICVVV